MSILIKGMEMPKNCHSCPMCIMRFCQAADRELSERETRPNAKRPDDCPLVPAQPHGRLIDADALAEHKFVCIPHVSIDGKDAGTAYRLGWNTAIEAVMENAETIIGEE